VVIAHIDNKRPMGFLINSKISNWLRKRPGLLICEVSISAAEHTCLRYDSFVDCRDLFSFNDWEIKRRVAVSEQAKIAILQAIRDCPTIERKYKAAILQRDGHLLEESDDAEES
jgi:hypothetical protein